MAEETTPAWALDVPDWVEGEYNPSRGATQLTVSPAHGLAKSIEPITSYPSTYKEMNEEARGQIGRGVEQLGSGEIAKGAANVGLGTLGYVSSPISAALRTIVGRPIEEMTGIPKEYPEFAASLMLPMMGGRGAVPPPLSKSQEIAHAAERLGITIPKAAATESIPLKATSGAVKEMPIVGTPLVKASNEAAQGIENAVGNVAAGYGGGTTFGGGQAAKSGLVNWITDKSDDIADRLYGSVNRYINPSVTTDLSATKKAIADIAAKNAQAMLPVGKAVDLVGDAALRTPGGLTYEGIKTLRTRIGEMTKSGILPEGMSKGELKQIYGALTDDLRSAAQNAGGNVGLHAFDRANNLYSQIADKREALAKIVGADANSEPELVLARIMRMAGGKGGADIAKLTAARKAMGADNWNEVTSAIINRMGRAAEDSDFSGNRFVTSWNNLSEAGKKLLFNSTGNPNGVRAIDDLVKVSRAHKTLTDFGNPSGTARTVTVGAILSSAYLEPISTLTAALSGHVFARIMASPVTAKAATNWAKSYSAALRKPSPVAQVALANSTVNLSKEISAQTGIDPLLLYKQLMPSGVSQGATTQAQNGKTP